MTQRTLSYKLLLSSCMMGAGVVLSAQTIQMETPIAGSVNLVFGSNTDITTCPIPEAPIEWGMDVAWDSEDNVTRGTNYIGADIMRSGRISFQPSDLVNANGELSATQQRYLQSRLDHIAKSGSRTVAINCDHEKLNSANYYGKPEEWYKVIKATVKYARSKGFTITTVSPFNEPDYTAWGEGTQAHFKAIAKLIYEDPELEGIRISAGNTLNCDQALSWYNYMKPYVSEGNTHQLAGSFANYAKFWQTVRIDGNHATADELHNTMEAFVATHYGMQTGIWWGYDGLCRGEFCRASFYGKEIGYAENRDAWSAGTVYKRPDGRTDAFLGVSERQAKTSYYTLVNTDAPTYYDGNGPYYSWSIELPGGTGYATEDQRNAERLVQIQTGADVPVEPVRYGQYVLMNCQSGKALGFQYGQKGDAVNLAQGTYSGSNPSTHQRWIVAPVSNRIGGDFSYYYLKSVRDSAQVADIKDWSTASGAGIIGYAGGLGSNEQWAFEYAGHGNWYIRSRHSGLYLQPKQIANATSVMIQSAFTGNLEQQWRLMPINVPLDMTAPNAPTGLSVTSTAIAHKLQWEASTSGDKVGYEVLRGKLVGEKDTVWAVIGRMIADTQFEDNDVCADAPYVYAVRTLDKSRNRSALSACSKAVTLDKAPQLVAHYSFDSQLTDATGNGYDAVGHTLGYSTTSKKAGSASLTLTGKQAVQLPTGVVSRSNMSVALWYSQSNTTTSWTRIFDFGSGTGRYMFLTANSGSDMRLVMKNDGEEQILKVTKPGTGWHHVVVTLSDEQVCLYIDGNLVGSADQQAMSIRPSDFHPVLNYLGRSQYDADPLYRGYIDDLRIYNYAITSADVQTLKNGQEIVGMIETKVDNLSTANERCYNLYGQPQTTLTKGINLMGNRKIMVK